MTSPFQLLAQEEYSQNPNSGMKNPYSSPFQQLAAEEQEGFWKSAARTALQIPQGISEATHYGIATGLFQLGALGESDLDIETWHKLRELAEQEGKEFDEEAYEQARQEMLGMIPTVSNIARKVEEKTGLPLEPKTHLQKGLRLGSTAAKFQPGSMGQKATAGLAAPATSEALQAVGVPEVFSEPLGLLAGGYTGTKGPNIDFGKSKKSSGLIQRQFEGITKPTEVPQKKINKINDKLEKDFRNISDNIIKESPVGETAENLAKDPLYKQESRELLNQAQEIADSTPGVIPAKSIKKEYADVTAKNVKGYALGEYDKAYLKYMKESIDNVVGKDVTHGQLVEQYRKNNKSLSEYFEPGSSKALNRAKKDALLDQNRAIANLIEKSNPELSLVFKDGNQRWTKIMDAEAVDSFISEIFPEGGKVNYKKMHDLFDKNGYDRIFKRALGDEGYKAFEQLTKDMLNSEAPYKMLRVAKEKGWGDLYQTASSYILHPKLGQAKLGLDALKYGYRSIINAMLDKPKFSLTWKKAVNDLKKGNFKEADKGFKSMEAEVEVLPKESTPLKGKQFEDIDAKVTPIKKTKQLEQIEFQKKQESRPENQLPKQIEYKPKLTEKQSLKERAELAAKDSFNEIISGQKVSPSEKEVLKNIDVYLMTTRGKGNQFHGSRKPINKLNPEIYDVSGEQNIYGAGFYTTDALDIADGYSRSKRSKTPTVYKVSEKTPQNLYDMEIPMTKEVKDKLKYYIDEYGSAKTVRDIYDNITDLGDGLPTYEVQEALDGVSSALQNLGYDGISHKGGLLTNNPEHKVKIYWKPENLEIQEFSYPKEFKKVVKTAKPPELPSTPTKPKPKPKIPAKITQEKASKNVKQKNKTTTLEEDISEIKKQIIETQSVINSTKDPKVEKIFKDQLKKLKKYEIDWSKELKNRTKKEKTSKSLTETEVQEVKRQDISKKGLKQQKEWLIEQLDKAIEKAPEGHEDFGKKYKSGSFNSYKETVKSRSEPYELLTFEIPGDGVMKIRNNRKALEQFKKSVNKKWPDKPLKLSKKDLQQD